MKKHFVFTITAGRTGTHSLTELLHLNLSNAKVYHEFINYDSWGLDSPDISHMTLFNSVGNVPKVQNFWRIKLQRILRTKMPVYVETSHLLVKAGLVENLNLLPKDSKVTFICLSRDVVKTVLSYRRTHMFDNKILLWSQFLDPLYPRNILNSEQLLKLGLDGICIWYIFEMMARKEYYKLLLKDMDHIQFIDVDIKDLDHPDRVSTLLSDLGVEKKTQDVLIPSPLAVSTGDQTKQIEAKHFEQLKKILENISYSPSDMAAEFLAKGWSLGATNTKK